VTDLLAGLDDGQREAVLAPSGPVCVLAGAGTGKTRTITHRIANLIATGAHPVSEVLAVTFTTRAAGEMRLRLRGLGVPGVQARTFHSAALKQLRYFWPKSVGGTLWPVLENKMRLVAMAARRTGAGTDTATLRDLAGEIEWAKATLAAPDSYQQAVAAALRDTPVAVETAAKVFAVYESIKTESQQLDFDDLLLHACAILETDEAVAREFRARYRCFVVDEYQDVTPLQQRMLDAWLGGRDQLTVVGDANQTIYSFAGASPRYLLGFDRKSPGATIVRLERDYRSTPQVVTLANRIIAGATGTTARLRLKLVAVLPDGPEATFNEYSDEPAEAAAVAQQIAARIQAGAPASSMAILFRINAQSEAYEQALTAASVPYVVRGGQRFFARAEVRQAMVTLRSRAARAADGDTEQPAEVELVALVRRLLAPIGLSDDPPPPGALRDRWDSLLGVVSIAEELVDTDGTAGLQHLVTELEQRAEAQHAPNIDGVTLASLHAAKGLEWDAVFLVGLTDGTLPIQHADTPEQVEEERRLFYVGVTRARTRLAVSWALSRTEGGRRSRRRSRFLTGLAPDQPAGSRTRTAGRCRICGGRLTTPAAIKIGRCENCPSTADPDLVEALRQWRRRRSTDDSVPAYVVFSDATLLAIAERRPTDADALLAIPGIGRSKLDNYGSDVLQLVTGSR
jgi:DNA helicase-2/ATP-dependent DNA helicase PcrA